MRPGGREGGVIARVLILLLRAYQATHVAFFRGSCRFHPTCSHYAVEAVELHGPARGSLLAAWRVLRCHPFCRGGFDPVPDRKSFPRRTAEFRKQPLHGNGSGDAKPAARPL